MSSTWLEESFIILYNLEETFPLRFNIVFKALLTGAVSWYKGKSFHFMYFVMLDVIEWYSKKIVLTLYLLVNSSIVSSTFTVPKNKGWAK